MNFMDDPKLTALSEYLKGQFSEHDIHCVEDKACAGWLFRIDDSRDHSTRWLMAPYDFLACQTVKDLDGYLEQHRVGGRLTTAGSALVRLTNNGPRVE